MSETMRALAAFDPFGGEPRGGAPPLRSYLLLDVFTDARLQGNPLAVFTDGRGIEQQLMQRIARELNLSETVFLLEPERGGDARLRIFTPQAELPFAGHPTLGSAAVLAGALAASKVTLETAAGEVHVEIDGAGGAAISGSMLQPIPTWSTFGRPLELLSALGAERAELPIEIYVNGPSHVCVALDSRERVAELRPDMRALADLGPLNVSCFAGGEDDFKTRMFAPGIGIDEDPASGSAAGPVALHLCRHGRAAYGRQIVIGQGAEIGRPSTLLACITGSAARVEQVRVGGSAVFVARAQMRLG